MRIARRHYDLLSVRVRQIAWQRPQRSPGGAPLPNRTLLLKGFAATYLLRRSEANPRLHRSRSADLLFGGSTLSTAILSTAIVEWNRPSARPDCQKKTPPRRRGQKKVSDRSRSPTAGAPFASAGHYIFVSADGREGKLTSRKKHPARASECFLGNKPSYYSAERYNIDQTPPGAT